MYPSNLQVQVAVAIAFAVAARGSLAVQQQSRSEHERDSISQLEWPIPHLGSGEQPSVAVGAGKFGLGRFLFARTPLVT